MATVLTDPDLDRAVEAERIHRGHATRAKTLAALVRERLMQLDMLRNPQNHPQAISHPQPQTLTT